MTRKEYEKKIAALEPLDEERRKSVTCALLGRGCFYDPLEVRVGHNCPTCRANYEKLGWEDKILTPDPFSDENSGGAE